MSMLLETKIEELEEQLALAYDNEREAQEALEEAQERIAFLESGKWQFVEKLQHRVDHLEKMQANGRWHEMDSAPKDGTLVLLLVDVQEGDPDEYFAPLEDERYSRTVGFCCEDHNGDPEWQFSGYNWMQDHFTQGGGVPIRWAPLKLATNERQRIMQLEANRGKV